MRTWLEVTGVAVAIAIHFLLAVLYLLGTTLVGGQAAQIGYGIAIAAGYLAMAAAVLVRHAGFPGASARTLLDAWLVAAPAAFLVTVALVVMRLPVRFQRWDGHGMGASGGEANAVFYPWLHLALWIVAARLWSRRTAAAE